MPLAISLVLGMLVAWVALGVILLVLIIYRSRLSAREEGQLFLDPGEAHLEREQREVFQRIERLTPYLWGVFITWLALGVATSGLWVWQQLR